MQGILNAFTWYEWRSKLNRLGSMWPKYWGGHSVDTHENPLLQ